MFYSNNVNFVTDNENLKSERNFDEPDPPHHESVQFLEKEASRDIIK